MELLQRIACSWCGVQNAPGATTCNTCGAPLDVKNVVSDSGWRAAPRLRDMTELHFGSSTCQVEGKLFLSRRSRWAEEIRFFSSIT